MLDWVLGRKKGNKKPKAGQKKTPSYDEAKRVAAKGDAKARAELASHEDLAPEFLYFFATEKTPQYVKPLQKTMALLCKLTLFWPKTLISKFEKSWHIRLVASYQL